MLVGIIADTHITGPDGIEKMPRSVLEAFRGADLILHCGDLGTSTAALDELEAIAPLKATLGGHNPQNDERVREDQLVVEVEGVRIGLTFQMEKLAPSAQFIHEHHTPMKHRLEFPADLDIEGDIKKRFGRPVDVVAFGGTHAAYVGWHQGVMFVNPGSPTLPEPGAEPEGIVKPAVAPLYIQGGTVSPLIMDLESSK